MMKKMLKTSTFNSVYIYPYKAYSKSADDLSEVLDVSRIKHRRSKFVGRRDKRVINWGSSEVSPEIQKCRIINKPERVKIATNKLSFFQLCSKVPEGERPRVVPWTTDKEEVKKWLQEGYEVFARTVLTGHSGNGIVLVPDKDNIPNASLYTKYIKKDKEFRVHVMNGKVFDAQRKIRDPQKEPINWKIRSHHNGFIYVRNNIQIPENVKEEAIKAIKAISLDFGGVDIIVNRKQIPYVLEINTAVGLEGETLINYATEFKKLLNAI